MAHRATATTEVKVEVDDAALGGFLGLPEPARGLVVFAHGSGSSRYSGRNRYVAGVLNDAGFATLLFDLLTVQESDIDQYTRALRFDIALLTRRLLGAADWTRRRDDVGALPLGLFGASTGAAAALGVAALRPHAVAAVVSRGGRPDLADALAQVAAPTLLVVGGDDHAVIGLNRSAASRLRCVREVALVAGATHLFEEPGALEAVARLACEWFLRHCVRHGRA